MADFIPKREGDRLVWASGFVEWLKEHGEDCRVSREDVLGIVAAAEKTAGACEESDALHAAAHEAAVRKKGAVADMFGLIRPVVRWIQVCGEITDDDRVAAGLPVHKTTRTYTPKDYVAPHPPPRILIRYDGGDEFAIHCGPCPDNENKNGKPSGIRAFWIEVARGGIPEDEDGWRKLTFFMRSPCVLPVDDADPGPNAYRAAYVGTRGGTGPWSAPVVFTVSRLKED